MRPDDVGLGGFDSHTLPPARDRRPRPPAATRAASAARLASLALVAWSATLGSTPAAAQRRDSVAGAAPVARVAGRPPIAPRRAFLYSVLVPGLGQAALDRKYTGAAFFLVEALALSLVHRSAEDLRIARAFRGDSVPLRYDIDAETGLARRDARGDPLVAEWQKSGYTNALVRARKLQLEDWIAVVIFNHLLAGADAFVAANLWDLPEHVTLRAYPAPRRGAGLALSVAFR